MSRTFAILLLAVAVVACSVRPEPLSDADIGDFARSNLAAVTEGQEPVGRPIDLYEAMARALKYNLDYKVEAMEKALKIRQLDLASYKLLPDLVSNSGYAGRSNFTGSRSRLLTGGRNDWFQDSGDLGATNVLSSTAQERDIFTQDITFTWHILDFGLSYVRAKQQANEVLIAREVKRKVVNRVIEDVRTAFWRAISSERLVNKLRALQGRVQAALNDSRKLYKLGETSPITALTYERELVEIKRQIQELEGELNISRHQLAALMNLEPGSKFRLAQPRRSGTSLRLKMPVDRMVTTALENRPELLEVQYKLRINEQERDAAFLELLPGLQLYAGANLDSNDYLFNSHWLSWGARASWNVIRLFQYPARKSVIAAEDDLLKQRALAVTMAVMTQVHVSRVRFLHYRKELSTAAEYLSVQRRLVQQMRNEAKADRISEQTLIREEMNTLVAEVKYDIAHANLQNAFANVFASMGLDPHGKDFDDSEPVASLAGSLRKLWIERGDYKSGAALARLN